MRATGEKLGKAQEEKGRREVEMVDWHHDSMDMV